MLNGKKRGIEAGILLAVTVWAACQTEESGLAANIAASDAFVSEMAMQEKTISNAVQTAAQEGKAAVQEAEKAAEEAAVRKEEIEPEGSFTVIYRGEKADREIELRHCDCVYDADDIQIYAEYLYWLMVPESFPYNQYVLYVRTPQEEFQIYPVKDFLVDKPHGILYTKIAGNDGFECVKSLPFTKKEAPLLMLEEEVFNAEAAEKMLCDAYGGAGEKEVSGGEALFSNITVELTEMDAYGAGILNGEAGGIEKSTGERCYVNWKSNPKSGNLTAEAYILKQYDPIKDKEELAACSQVFDEIEQGDWSHVGPIEKQYLWGVGAEEWIRLDVNGDGMPELLGGWSFTLDDLTEYGNYVKRQISTIFTYRDGMAELVYVDDCDGMEYFFVTEDGELIYEWGVSGWPCTSVFRKSRFDPKWNVEYLDTIVRYRFEEYEEEERAYFQEAFPDTYGVGGSGVYYLRERPKTEEELKRNQDGKYVVREYLTEEAFLKLYEDWTGWDFYKAEYMY